MTDERLKYCQDIIELTNTDSIYSEIGKELLNEISALQQQNAEMKKSFEIIHGIASETFESHNQLELIRFNAAEHIEGGHT